MTVGREKGRLEWGKQLGQNWKALACIAWDHGSKDSSGLDGSKVATEQYMFSCQTW